MRFLLALWVVLYHQSAEVAATNSLPAPIFNVVRSGYAAVGIFFVLSGFILAYNYDLGAWTKGLSKKFAIARFARIYPVYLLSLLVLSPLWIKAIFHAPAKQAAFGFWHFTLLQSWIPTAALVGYWNGPSWSISDEAFFYLTFPFVGALMWRYAKSKQRIIAHIVGLWALIIAIQLVAIRISPAVRMTMGTVGNLSDPALSLVSYNPLLRLPEFLCGILSCRLYFFLREEWAGRGYWFYIPGFLCCIATIVLLGTRVQYVMFSNGAMAPAVVLIILGLALGGGTGEKLLSARPLVFLGGASFSIYLLHSPIRIWAATLHIPKVNTVIGSAAYTCVVILVSSLIFIYFEEPLNRIVRSRLSGTRVNERVPAQSPRAHDMGPMRFQAGSEFNPNSMKVQETPRA